MGKINDLEYVVWKVGLVNRLKKIIVGKTRGLGTIIRRISGLGHCFNKIDWIAVGKIRELGNCYCVSCNRKIVVRKLLLWKLQLGNSWMWKLLLWKLQLGNCYCGNCNWEIDLRKF